MDWFCLEIATGFGRRRITEASEDGYQVPRQPFNIYGEYLVLGGHSQHYGIRGADSWPIAEHLLLQAEIYKIQFKDARVIL